MPRTALTKRQKAVLRRGPSSRQTRKYLQLYTTAMQYIGEETLAQVLALAGATKPIVLGAQVQRLFTALEFARNGGGLRKPQTEKTRQRIAAAMQRYWQSPAYEHRVKARMQAAHARRKQQQSPTTGEPTT